MVTSSNLDGVNSHFVRYNLPMALEFKRVTENDWETTSAIEKAVDDGHVFKAFTTEAEAREYLRKSIVYLVMLENKPIGTISYEPKSKDHAYIDSMTTLPEHQGKGYASKALEWLLEQLKDVSKVDLVTHPHNSKSIGIYLKHGFVINGWKDNYFGDGEPRIEMIFVKTKQ